MTIQMGTMGVLRRDPIFKDAVFSSLPIQTRRPIGERISTPVSSIRFIDPIPQSIEETRAARRPEMKNKEWSKEMKPKSASEQLHCVPIGHEYTLTS